MRSSLFYIGLAVICLTQPFIANAIIFDTLGGLLGGGSGGGLVGGLLGGGSGGLLGGLLDLSSITKTVEGLLNTVTGLAGGLVQSILGILTNSPTASAPAAVTNAVSGLAGSLFECKVVDGVLKLTQLLVLDQILAGLLSLDPGKIVNTLVGLVFSIPAAVLGLVTGVLGSLFCVVDAATKTLLKVVDSAGNPLPLSGVTGAVVPPSG